MWFEELTGFVELSPSNVRDHISIDGKHLISKNNNRSFQFGKLDVSSLEDLRKLDLRVDTSNQIKVTELVADIQKVHCDPNNANALFQAASQFNLLVLRFRLKRVLVFTKMTLPKDRRAP